MGGTEGNRKRTAICDKLRYDQDCATSQAGSECEDANNRCGSDTVCVKERLYSRRDIICKRSSISIMTLNGTPKRQTCRWVSSTNYWECHRGSDHPCVGKLGGSNVNVKCSTA